MAEDCAVLDQVAVGFEYLADFEVVGRVRREGGALFRGDFFWEGKEKKGF